ncbi:MAG: hypothetical protein KatS3mg111_0561 [Pirellulaceae bacterium]|nr:MAG: hypothetical protein KatS3mg111_0561 [Pirellulaceae bacterium]
MQEPTTMLRRYVARTRSTWRSAPGRWWLAAAAAGWLVGWFIVPSALPVNSQEPESEVKVWEFSPYEVEIAYAVQTTRVLDAVEQQKMLDTVEDYLENTFRAAWRTHLSPISLNHVPIVTRRFDTFTLDDLRRGEFVLVVSHEHQQAKSVRTYEGAAESLTEVAVDSVAWERLQFSRQMHGDVDEITEKLWGKVKVHPEGAAAIYQGLADGSIAAALVPRAEWTKVAEFARSVITLLPWQTDHLLRRRDKIIFLLVSDAGDRWSVRARELDCPMQYLGIAFQQVTPWWEQVPRVAAAVIVDAYAPVARVEDAEARSAKIRLRAGGLIVREENPAKIRVGDVLQPIVRRNDRYGQPTLLEPLKWTYAAVVKSDGIHADVNVYTYSGGPGLQGRRNRRTQRLLLRVRPRFPQTELKLVIRERPDESIPGSFIYFRDLLTEEFQLQGRTDWRGIFPITVPQQTVHVLPEEIRAARAQALREQQRREQQTEQSPPTQSSPDEGEAPRRDREENKGEAANAEGETAQQDAAPSGQDAEDQGEEPGEERDKNVDSPDSPRAEAPGDQFVDASAIPLNQPLVLVYVKNGDRVLAKLPLVPGIQPMVVAELPDDQRRLRAEAFVRGFQGEVLDMVGLRSLLAAQVQLYVEKGDRQRAEEALRHLRRLPNYTEMADRLERIQREILTDDDGAISRAERAGIDRMFQVTRDMLQKYLQDTLLPESERVFRRKFGDSADANSQTADGK